ncbi:hypothetical protein [Bradyrhizobium sp.]|uniref:hypothetical protein n=1 Tax=Bradyrhizobium sp. TaxID=376 RepID=UPI0040376EDC
MNESGHKADQCVGLAIAGLAASLLPGALAALVELKLSDNAQFRHLPGACKLMGTAVVSGDQTWRSRLSGCRGS